MRERILARRGAFVAALAAACRAKSAPDSGVPADPSFAMIEHAPAPSASASATPVESVPTTLATPMACLIAAYPTSSALPANGDVYIAPAQMSVPVSGADRVVAGLRAGIRACYQRGLQQNPHMRGTLSVTVKVDPKGSVTDATKASGKDLAPSVEACVIDKLKRASFDAPGGLGSTLVVTLTFTP